jgi:hypothetical protein
MEVYMVPVVTNFLITNSNTILRTLGATTVVGSVAHFVHAERNGEGEASATKVQRLALHNAVAALGAAITLLTFTTKNAIGKKTRLFCLAATAATVMYPTVVMKVALWKDGQAVTKAVTE